MRILLTNDDGYQAKGLHLLKEKLSKYGQVVVVAPKTVMSAKSVSVTLGRAVEVVEVSKDFYYMDGTPADCVAFGLSSLGVDFDLVVSGCNDGFNISYDIMYSGTVGACLQALTHRKKAIAFSAQDGLFLIDKYFYKVFDYILEKNMLSTEYALNVNFPLGDEMVEIKQTGIYYRKESTYYIRNTDGLYFATRDIHDEMCLEENTDVYAVYHKIVSITKINKTNELMEEN